METETKKFECHRVGCKKTFTFKDLGRQYGVLSPVYVKGYCGAGCFTKDTLEKRREKVATIEIFYDPEESPKERWESLKKAFLETLIDQTSAIDQGTEYTKEEPAWWSEMADFQNELFDLQKTIGKL